MSDIRVFQNDKFGLVRTIDRDGEPWFLASDICIALGLSNTTEALRALDPDERSMEKLKAGTRMQDCNVVSESGMYALIMRSNKPEARAFRKWVTSVVLPQIRKTGNYGNMSTDALVEKTVNNPDWVIKILNAYKDEKKLRHEAEEQRDIAVRQRISISNKREATLIGRLSAKSKECTSLRKENVELKQKLGIEVDEESGKEFLYVKSIPWVAEMFGENYDAVSRMISIRLGIISRRLHLEVKEGSGRKNMYSVTAIKALRNQIECGDVPSISKFIVQ